MSVAGSKADVMAQMNVVLNRGISGNSEDGAPRCLSGSGKTAGYRRYAVRRK